MYYAPLEDHELSTPFAVHRLVPALVSRVCSGSCAAEALRKQLLRTTKVAREVEQFGVIAELLEDVDCLQRLRVRSTEQCLDLRRRDEETI